MVTVFILSQLLVLFFNGDESDGDNDDIINRENISQQ